MLSKILKITAIAGIILISLSLFYYFVMLPYQKQNPTQKMSSEEIQLRKDWQNYWDLIEVNQCQKAFDEYLSKHSQVTRGFDNFRLYGCEDRKELTNVQIEKVVFSDKNRADIKIYFTPYSPNYHWDVETWIREDGQWKRNF